MAGVQAGSAGRLSIEIVAEIARLQNDLDKAKRAVNAASQDIAKSAKHANDNLSSIGSGVGKFNSRQVTNLAFQVQDLGVQFAAAAQSEHMFRMGLMALIQQGPQIGMIMKEAGVGARGLGAALVEMAGGTAVLAGLAAGASTLAIAFGLVTAEVNKNAAAHVSWQDVALGTYDAIKSELNDGVTKAFVGLGISIADMWDTAVSYTKTALNVIIGGVSLVPRMVISTWSKIPAAVGEVFVTMANASIRALNGLLKASVDMINSFVNKTNELLAAAAKFVPALSGFKIPTLSAPQIGEIKNSFSGAGAAAGGAMLQSLADTFQKDFVGEFAGKISPFAQARARKRLAEDAKKAGGDAGRAAGKTAGDKMIDEFMASAKDLNALIARNLARDAKDVTAATKTMMDQIQAANDNAFTAQLESDNAERTRGLVEAAEATALWNERLSDTIDYLGRIGGLAGGLGEAAGLLQGIASGNYAGIPGKAGAIVGLLNQTDGGRELLDGFQGILKDTFKGGGVFAETLSSVLQGAGTGAAVAGIVGNGSSGSQLGGMIGGALGQEFGKRAIGMVSTKLLSSLGAAAGPLGAIAGSILGSVVGGLFKGGPDWATTNLSSGASGGNKDGQKTGVSQAAGAFGDALKKIADTLGATVGSFNTSIGLHNNNWHVSTDGRTGVLRSSQAGVTDFKGDSQAALEFAIQDAISDGVFQGLSEGVQRLLKGEGDLDAKLQKAMSFQGVFDELAQMRDPQAYDLAGLDKWRAGMDSIFAEAGATADELAKLEELTGLKRLEITKKYQAETTDLEIEILQLQGKAEEALALSRQAELDAADASIRPLMERRNALLDEATAAQTAAAALAEKNAADDRVLALQQRYSRAMGDEGTAKAIERMQELNQAQTEQERSILSLIHATEKAAEVNEAAAATQAEMARQAQERITAAQSDLRAAVDAERKTIEDRLSPLRSELERLMKAIAPEPEDLVAAMQVKDLLTDGLAVAKRLSDAAKDVFSQNEAIAGQQREAALRELFRMAETRKIDAERIDDLAGSASNIGTRFRTQLDMVREQARTAGLLENLSRIQTEQANEAQRLEDARAAAARAKVEEQIEILKAQVATGEASLASLDGVLNQFGLLNSSVLSVADAIRNLQAALTGEPATAAGPSIPDMPASGGGIIPPAQQAAISQAALAAQMEAIAAANEQANRDYFDRLTDVQRAAVLEASALANGLIDSGISLLPTGMGPDGIDQFRQYLRDQRYAGVIDDYDFFKGVQNGSTAGYDYTGGSWGAMDNTAVVEGLQALTDEVAAMRRENYDGQSEIALNTKRTADLAKKADVVGTPPVRETA